MMFFDLWNQLKMSALIYFHNFSNKLRYSHHVSNFESYFYSKVARPIMIVAFLPYIVCWDATIAPYLTSISKTFILKFWAYLSHTCNG